MYKIVNLIAFILVIIGAINWLLISILKFDFVAEIFGSQTDVGSRIVFAIVGIAGLWLIFSAIINNGKININPDKTID